MLKAVKAVTYSLSLLGDVSTTMEDVTKQATAFMCTCYECAECNYNDRSKDKCLDSKNWAKN